jgi:cobalamin biosynthesis protein CobW
MIVVNKVDLLNDDEIDALTHKLDTESRDSVQVVRSSMGVLPVEILLGQAVGAENDLSARHEVHHHHHDDDDDDHHHDHDHDEFESFVVTRPEITDPVAFSTQVLETIKTHDILRLKGFIAVSEKPLRMTVQAVGPRIDSYFDRPFAADEPRQTRLVVIGEAGMDRTAIETALAS